ncbi:hypothetical protein RND81_01G064100 [Saponaria officinalis]|uniref:Uncharacterized protein n=1 Tax=Saponaria officinalis TaxID=3572 RepID=A0AAW1N8Y2_SAPOF
MENYRSISCREGRNNNIYNNNDDVGGGSKPKNMQDLRSYSTSYASTYMQIHPQQCNKDAKISNGNTSSNYKKSRGSGSSSSMKGWSLNDPEIQRKKRVVSYKVYAVEGKMKGSFRKSFRWFKSTCSHVVHGFW